MATKLERLEALQLGPTRWEVVAVTAAGPRYLVGYSARKSKLGLLAVLRGKGDLLVETFGITDDPPNAPKGMGSNDGILFGCADRFGGSVRMVWGWTERTAISSGETMPVEEVEHE